MANKIICSHLSLLFVLLRVSKLDHDGGRAPLHCDAVVHRLDCNHRNLEKGILLYIHYIRQDAKDIHHIIQDAKVFS